MVLGAVGFFYINMKCPYCGEELERGYIKSGRSIYWGKDEVVDGIDFMGWCFPYDTEVLEALYATI